VLSVLAELAPKADCTCLVLVREFLEPATQIVCQAVDPPTPSVPTTDHRRFHQEVLPAARSAQLPGDYGLPVVANGGGIGRLLRNLLIGQVGQSVRNAFLVWCDPALAPRLWLRRRAPGDRIRQLA
jgi:hypothetical protein